MDQTNSNPSEIVWKKFGDFCKGIIREIEIEEKNKTRTVGKSD